MSFHSLRVERDHRAMLVMQKRRVSPYPVGSTEALYLGLLTPFAFGMVKCHIETHTNVTIVSSVDYESFTVECHASVVVASVQSCSCLFNVSTGLPCRHIFAVRSHKKITVFDTTIVARRWTRNFYAGHQPALRGSDVPQSGQITLSTVNKPRILSAHQKFRMASIVATELATLVSEVPMRHFDSRLQQMRDLCNAWKTDRETAVQVLNARHEPLLEIGTCENDSHDNFQSDIEEGIVLEVDPRVNLDTEHASFVNNNENPEAVTACDGISDSYDIVDEVADMQAEKGSNVCLNDHSENNNVYTVFDSLSPNVDTMMVDCITRDVITEVVATVKEGEAVSKAPSDLLLTGIKIPPKMCKRGRPKGAEKTVIGLPKKRRHESKLLPFLDMSVCNKEKVFVTRKKQSFYGYLTQPAFVQCVLQGHVIGKEDIRLQATSLSTALLDDNVEVNLIRRLFTPDGWLSVKGEITNLKKNVSYSCGVCATDVGQAESICCDCCLLWCHLTCSGLNKPPKKNIGSAKLVPLKHIYKMCFSGYLQTVFIVATLAFGGGG